MTNEPTWETEFHEPGQDPSPNNAWAMVAIIGFVCVTVMVCCGLGAWVLVNWQGR